MKGKPLSASVIGILCVTGAGVCFSTGDMLIKFLSAGYPLHQIVFTRAAIALTIILGVLVPLEGGYRNLFTKRWKLHMLRGACVVVANLSFFTGLAVMPLAEATAIFFVAPLVITALSVPFLGETVGVRRWVSVVIGLVGVVIVIRPGTSAFQYAALGPLIAACAYASMQIMSRKLGVTEKASTMAFYIQFTFLIVCASFGLATGDGRFAEGLENPSLIFILKAWTLPNSFDAAILATIGISSAFGAYMISQGYRLAEATAIAPFEYVVLPMSIVWGVLVFDTLPDNIAFAGIALILGSGLYAFWRENVRGQVIATENPLPKNR